MKLLALEMKTHLIEKIIPFWESLKDDEYGGYYGYIDYSLKLDKNYEKGCILNSRILWFFSNAYITLKDDALLEYAKHSYDFLKDFCIDKNYGGVFWTLSYDGKPIDTTKHTYNQAFAIYALSSYYNATKDESALKLAFSLYDLIETKHTDEKGYIEALTIDYLPEKNDKLSENGVEASRTMNTLLHVFEAYSELYKVTKNEDVADKIKLILDVFYKKVYNKELSRQEVFFDENWNSLIDLHSYGHDIETAWLIDLGLDILNCEKYKEIFKPITENLTENVYNTAYKNNSLLNECESGIVDTKRVWWVQAEAVLGFLNGYEKNPENKQYLDAAKNIWNYIKDHIVDKRVGSEWFWAVDENNKPIELPIVEPWKCPYHNGRMCFEVLRRFENA